MNREFLINIVLLVSINLLIKPFYIFGIDRTVQNTVSDGEYGLYFSLFGFTFLFQIINDFGLQQFNNRNIAQHPFLLQKYFPRLLIIKILLNLIYLFVIFISAWIVGYEIEIFPLILYIGINQILISLVLFLRSNITGLGLYRTDSLLSGLEKTFLILICAVLLWGDLFEQPFRIEWFIWAQTVSWSLTALVAFWVIRRSSGALHFSGLGNLRKHFKPLFILAILKKSYPFALVILLMTIYTRIDSVMIERMLPDGKQEADVYAAAYRLLDAVNVVGVLFAGLLLPMFANLLKKKESVQSLVELSIKMIWAGAIPLAIATFFFKEEIMFWLYVKATPYYGQVLGYLILTFIAVCGIYIYSTLLTANASLKKMNWLFVISIILNVLLNYFLIKNFKASGAAVATLVTQFFVLFCKMILCKTEINIHYKWRMVLQVLGFTVSIVFLSFQLYHLPYPNWLVKFSANVFLGFGLAFVFRLINMREMVGMFREKI